MLHLCCSSEHASRKSIVRHEADVFVCGGARTFGAAMENVLLESLQEHKSFTFEEAEEYLRQMLHEGRLCEDLAD